jgi:3-deoxy-D-manno-octulosonic-acid transferase
LLRWLFNLAYLIAVGVTSPWWLYKSATTGKYRRGMWAKFVGKPPQLVDLGPVGWIHAVSVGEVLLLKPLLTRLKAESPDVQWLLSTTTNTGFDVAKEKYPDLPVFYAPLDFSWAVSRVFSALKPKLLVLTELELWPNLLMEASRRDVPVAVVNARVGERSFKGYRRVLPLIRRALKAIRWWGAQSEIMAERIRDLTRGLSTTIETTGSIKYDGAPSDRNNPKTAELRRLFGIEPIQTILVAGSTQGDEDRMLLECFNKLRIKHPSLRLILVPRHPERFEAVAEMLKSTGVNFQRRTEISCLAATRSGALPFGSRLPVILVDSVGELSAVWGLADLGYVGGSMGCNRGGQSMIEPAGYGVPVCFGSETWNFKDTVDKLLAADAARCVEHPDDLLAVLAAWLDDPAAAMAVGDRARRFIAAQRGAVPAAVRALVGLLDHPMAVRRSA